MRRRIEVKVGARFGRFVFLEEAETRRDGKRSIRYLRCRCDCGEIREVILNSLRTGNAKSCGCAAVERFTTHGKSKIPEYKNYRNMISRCTSPKSGKYALYGGRGIKVSPLWRHDFDAFYEYMGPKPHPKSSIERINSNGHYEPGNVRWAEYKEQNNNTSRNIFLELDG